MAKVIGLGGVFVKAQDKKALEAWYVEHLGLEAAPWGGVEFSWDVPQPDGIGKTLWTLFAADTKHFGGGPQQVMFNFRVDDMDGLLAKLSAAGVEIDPKRDDSEYGKFAWIVDPEGNRIELWQPVAETAA